MGGIDAVSRQLDLVASGKCDSRNIRRNRVLNIWQTRYVANLPLRRQYRATHRVAIRRYAYDLARRIRSGDEPALLIDYRIREAQVRNIEELYLPDIFQRAASEEVCRTGKERAVARYDERRLEVRDASGLMIRR